jgi:hypothetical protein
MNNHGASGAAIAGVLIIVIILIVVIYGFNSGVLNLGKSSSSKLPSTFSISAASNISQLYSGKSSPLYVTVFNPFNQSLNANLFVLTAPPVSISPSSKTITVPANMKTQSAILFNASCTSSTGSVIPYFALEVHNFWQNLTTSVITYPYGTKPSLVPKLVSFNPNQGFMTLSASPHQSKHRYLVVHYQQLLPLMHLQIIILVTINLEILIQAFRIIILMVT